MPLNNTQDDTSSSQLLLVFLKEPTPGKVKTRIAQETGEHTACLYYQAMVQVLLEQLEGLHDTDIRFYYAPDEANEAVPFWILPQLRGDVKKAGASYHFTPNKAAPDLTIQFHPQGEGLLGDRLQRAFNQGFLDRYKKIAVIGSDCPDCGSRWIQAGLTKLKGDKDCVIGPSQDGGYYLLALQEEHSSLFQNIDWSSEQVLEQTIAAAKQSSLSTHLLPALRDIDHKKDWEEALESPIGGKLKAALKRIEEQS